MPQKEITLSFDLDDEREQRVYNAIMNLPATYKMDLSKSFIRFMNNLVACMAECEERKNQCEGILKAVIGTVPQGRQLWN